MKTLLSFFLLSTFTHSSLASSLKVFCEARELLLQCGSESHRISQRFQAEFDLATDTAMASINAKLAKNIEFRVFADSKLQTLSAYIDKYANGEHTSVISARPYRVIEDYVYVSSAKTEHTQESICNNENLEMVCMIISSDQTMSSFKQMLENKFLTR
ncbi:MAG: hypothetical protein ACXWRA_05880 [Pseudobdellovibrionaceae bacterium]